MSFGVRKCTYIYVGLKRGKVYSTQDIVLCNGESICSLALAPAYKYLGLLEADVFQQSEVRDKVTKEYYRKVHLVLKSELNARNKFLSINAYAIPVVCYTVGLINWPTGLLKAIDRQTRKLLTFYKVHHPRADVDRLYLPQKIGGRGLKSMVDVVMEELCNISGYVKKTDQPLLQEVRHFGLVPELGARDDFVSRWQLERVESYHSKSLHGYYPQACAQLIDRKLSFLWLLKGFLTGGTEGLLLAAQDQALSTRAMQHVYSAANSPLCRLCGGYDETVEHLVSGCSFLAVSQYITRHNNVAKFIHWSLCTKFGLDHCEFSWNHCSPSVVENDEVKLLWDFNICTDKVISARCPDIIVINKLDNTAQFIDVSIPADCHIVSKENEKIEKYQDLRIELEKLWQKKNFVLSIVIGALGALSKKFSHYVDLLHLLDVKYFYLPRLALFGTASILRQVLQFSYTG